MADLSLFESLARDLKTEDVGAQQRATLRAFHLTLGVLALPGLPLGAAYALSRPASLPLVGMAGLLLVALVVGGAALWLSRRTAQDPRLKPTEARLAAAMQLASAPGAPLLLGCAAFTQPPLWLALWLVALAFYAVARTRIIR